MLPRLFRSLMKGQPARGATRTFSSTNNHVNAAGAAAAASTAGDKQPTIIYTLTDEAPLLATYSFLPILQAFARPAGVGVETGDAHAGSGKRTGFDPLPLPSGLILRTITPPSPRRTLRDALWGQKNHKFL